MNDIIATMPYRPDGQIEGEVFMDRWCGECNKDSLSKPCSILRRALAFKVDDGDYPRQWITDDERGPRCTAFEDGSAIEDERQVEMMV